MHTSRYNTVSAPRMLPLAFGNPPRGYGNLKMVLVMDYLLKAN